jgi:hypothetical protein
LLGVKRVSSSGIEMVCATLPWRFHKCGHNFVALTTFGLFYQVNGKAWFPPPIIISRFWKKDSKVMKRKTFYVFSDECYVGSQKKEPLQKSFYLTLG